MIGNVLEYLEITAGRVPDKAAYTDGRETITYARLLGLAQAVGSALSGRISAHSPVAVLMDPRDARCVAAFMGVLYAGCFYVPLDPYMPQERLQLILDRLSPAQIIFDGKNAQTAENAGGWGLLAYEEAAEHPVDEPELHQRRLRSSAFDLVTVLYTSGSTGIPKGVAHHHYSFIAYTEYTNELYGFTQDTVFGNQSPFFYANSIIDIYPPIALGASTCMIPANAVTFPKRFIDFLNEHRVTEMTMTPSSYIQLANSGLITEDALPHLTHIIMSGEAMPWRQLKQWMQAAPNAGAWNFYGSTEMFPVSVHRIDQEYGDGDILPVGRPYKYVHVLFLDENGQEVPYGEAGEMFVSSPWVSVGYYGDAERTAASFVLDPLGRGYYERFYRSGDLGRINERGQLVVLGRGDSQIKHMGYRMELGEVEYALRALPGWQDGCCLFNKETGQIFCFWDGGLTQKEIIAALKEKLPKYMLPDRYVHLEALPHTANMKIDRNRLKAYFSPGKD